MTQKNTKTKKYKRSNTPSVNDIIEMKVQRRKTEPIRKSFEPDPLLDKILIDIIDFSRELKELEKNYPNNIFVFAELPIEIEYKEATQRKQFLKTQLQYLTGLMVA